MNSISRKPFSILSIFIRKTPPHHFKFSHSFSFSTQTSLGSVPSYPSRRQEEESRNVRVSVWWDFENCSLPYNVNVFRVARCITNAIRANGIRGPIQITAFGDVMRLSRANQEALSATGINLSHVPFGGKSSADRSLLVDLIYWVSQNPPPAHVFLISSDRDFACILHRLRMNNYNILLASKDDAPSVLCSAASIMWQWHALLMGDDNLTGKHFNQPPEGPYSSWYGHDNAPLEDPFAVTEQSVNSPSDKISDSGSDSKVRPIPKAVIKQIRRILDLHPNGIVITELRSELAKFNLTLDKDFYGYKRFSRFLSAMPHVLKLQSDPNGQFLIHGVNPKVSDESLQSEDEIGCVRKGNGTTEKSEKEVVKVQPKIVEESSPTKMKDVQEKDQKVDLHESVKNVELPSPPVEIIYLLKDTKSQGGVVVNADLGFFRRMWKNLFRSKDNDSKKTNCCREKLSNGKKRVEGKNVMSACHHAESASPVSPSSHERTTNGRIARSSDSIVGKSSKFFSIFNQMMTWCKFQGSADCASEESDKEVKQIKIDCKKDGVFSNKADSLKDDIFSNKSFWNELEIFMNTSEGLDLVLWSSTRVHLAENLQRQGPSVLRSLHESNLLHLVNLLISDKKWVEESHSQTYPFKVVSNTCEDQCDDHPPVSGRLRSMLLSQQPPSTLLKLEERKHQSRPPPHAKVPQNESHKDCSIKSKEEILIDCQKLMDHILKEYPEGFDMSLYKDLFLQKYGHAFDLQKLGYKKLVSMLQMMPGVTIESNCIYPFEVSSSRQGSNICSLSNSDSESSDGLRKNDESGSPWEELGPVANNVLEEHEIDSRFSEKPENERTRPTLLDYEPLGEDDLSSSDEESSSTKLEMEAKSRLNQEDRNLVQILDSLYSKEGDDNSRKDEFESMSNVLDCSKNGTPHSAPTEFVTKTEPTNINQAKKLKELFFCQ